MSQLNNKWSLNRAKGKTIGHNVWAFVAMAFALLSIIILFQYATFHFLSLTALFHEPTNWFAFWLPKIAAAIILASPLLLTRRRLWSVFVLLLVALWAVANNIYFHENNILITLDAIRMVGNLKGFEDSATSLFNTYAWVNMGLVGAYALLVLFLNIIEKCSKLPNDFAGKKRPLWWFICALLIGCVCSLGGGYCLYKTYQHSNAPGLPEIVWSVEWLNPFSTPTQIEVEAFQMERRDVNYTMNHSVVAYAVEMLYKGISLDMERKGDVSYTEREHEILRTIYHPERKGEDRILNQNLIILLVESLESWPLNLRDTDGNEVTPNINKLLQSEHVFYADKISSQARAGRSGDGQMTINSGLLPLMSGAACILYAYNDYPSFAPMFERSVLVTPTKNTWNKSTMFKQYGYKSISQPEDAVSQLGHNKPEENWWDEQILPIAADSCEGTQPYVMTILTLSMHSPFNLCPYSRYKQSFPTGIPESLDHYLACTHYADDCIRLLIERLDNIGALANTTLVITGDHSAFYDLNEFAPYAQNNFGFGEENYCPLIIISPHITSHVEQKQVAFQMDIYPTILSVLGCEDYFWKGFGANLMSDTIVRPCEINEAWVLSDKLIRDNYFAKH